jgi:hypothetical protein
MKYLFISDLEKMNSDVKEVVDVLMLAINDWPNQVVKLEDYEIEVSKFIGQEATAKGITLALTNIDYSVHSWQAESLSELLNVFNFYDDNVSLKEIIEGLKTKLH